jgi:DNA-binding response OmpR family regulator
MNYSVLIVDDSLTVRMDLAEVFGTAGFTPILCGTVAEAREILGGDPVDAVILDVLLPDGDGVELLKEVRASPSADAMVMMLSMEADIKDRIRGLQTGADEYVGKPYDANHVVARARAFLRSRQTDAASDVARGKATILIIDDSLTFREELREACEEAGYRVLVAASGEEGLRIAADHRPTAMVVDGMLPGIDGATVIRRVRVDAALRGVPCLLLTAMEGHDEELRALDAGADAFVRKTEAISVILARLGAILRSGQSHSDDRAIASLQGPKKVLAVDDSETFLQELAEALRAEGYEVVLARSGEEALKLLSVQSVDCILLDLIMPGMGGQDVCRRIKDDPATRNIPVLMLTAREDQEAIIEGLGAGADDYITKANDFQVLRARVLAQIRRKQFEDENRRIREQILHRELEATEQRAARELAETRAALADELAQRNDELAAAKAQLEAYARILEDRVKERSDQLGNVEQQLRQAQKMEAIGQLTGGVAHDFNNLLGIVTGNLDLLIERLEGDPFALELAQEALEGALRGATLTQRMLAFARKQPLQPKLTDLNEALVAMTGILTRALREDITIAISPAEDLWAAFCDKHQVEDVILNFAINARDAMPDGGKLLIETANAQLDEEYAALNIDVTVGDYVMLAVTDSGTGMPPEVIERAFDPFFTTKSTGKGTGLGLSMVYGFAKQSGGHVKIYSEVGHGTTIKLYLPRAAKEAGSPPIEARRQAPVRAAENETILVVEDDPGLRQVAVKLIADLGYAVRQAENPKDALAILAVDEGIDLVFSDIVMPGGMTGVNLAAIVKDLYPAIRVLLTTGYSEVFIKSEDGNTQQTELISKPYRKQDLAEKIRSMLDGVVAS